MPIAASKVGVDAHAVSARTAGKGWQSRGEDCIATTEDLESKHDARDQQSVANYDCVCSVSVLRRSKT